MGALIPQHWRSSVDGLRDRVMHTFDRWLPARKEEVLPDATPWPGYLHSGFGPAIDVAESDKALQVTAELPGMDEKDFHVELDGHRLILHGDKKAGREEERDGYYYAESSYGSFYRTVPLPCEVDEKKVKANYKHGVLTVTLPKTKEAMAKAVRIQVH